LKRLFKNKKKNQIAIAPHVDLLKLQQLSRWDGVALATAHIV